MPAPITTACLPRTFDIVCSPGQPKNSPSRSPRPQTLCLPRFRRFSPIAEIGFKCNKSRRADPRHPGSITMVDRPCAMPPRDTPGSCASCPSSDVSSITGRHVPGRGRAARRPGHAVHRLGRGPTTRWRGRLGPLVMGAAACFVRTMTGAGGSMRGRSAPPRAALLTLLAHLCMASAARWRGRAGRAVPAVCGAAVPAAGPQALAALPTPSGV